MVRAKSSGADILASKPYIVGIGASAGGVQALQKIFEYLPPDTGASFVVILHLDPGTHSELAAVLAQHTKMPVTQVIGTLPLHSNHIYVIPPDRQLQITDHQVSATPFTQPRGQRAPIDLLFRSLAEQHENAYAVILTGAGSDGAVGIKAVKEAGGVVLVQSPEEAEYPSMPRAAIATDATDFILPLRELAAQLAELIKNKKEFVQPEKLGDEEEQLRRVLAHLRVRTGHDFSHYKRSTIMRRLVRRIHVTRKETLADYFSYLRENVEEVQALLADLLISVTTFFRDSKAFESLAKHVIPRLFEDKRPGDCVRVWVAGCATGEEAYSVAILLLEEASKHDLRPEMQIFASDMDGKALAAAREGRYSAAIEADVNEERLRRFFSRDGEHYRVRRELRDIILFASHSILKDPPFSRLDLISCRNLLIYLDRDLQQQVLLTLHYGLNSDGYLFLGSSESGEHPDGLFRPIDRDARIFQSTGRSKDRLPALPRLAGLSTASEPLALPPEPQPTSVRAAQAAHRDALESWAPPSVLVDETFRVLHLSENAGRYFLPSAGPLTTDITDLVRPELRFELRSALNRAFERSEASLTGAALVRFNGSGSRVYMQIRPVAEKGNDKQSRRAVIFFIEGGANHSAETAGELAEQQPTSETIHRLKHELELTQSQLRTTREESESANEELRAANEELQSINEEYRSTAEELETSKEELQSINEELQTVNSELKIKLETVSRANSDLQNFMAATDFATLFLDPGLRIKRFTPRLASLFNVTPADAGRPITDFTHQLEYEGLAADTRQVLDHLVPIEREIQSRDGRWYQVRFRPYRTVDDKIDGVVVTFVDMTERRRMEDALRDSERNLRQEMQLVELSRAPIFVWNFDGTIMQWNRGSEELYGYTKEEAVGKRKNVLLKTEIPGSSFEAMKEELREKGTWKGEINHITKDGRKLVVESQIELISTGERQYVLESTRDITQNKVWEQRQRLLLRELTHRVKNTLTVIQSLVQQTWRNSDSPEDFIERLNGRISAIADAHMLLVASDWRGADLNGLIQSQVKTYVSGNPKRLHLKGEPVILPAEIATPFGLVLHELATNAAKYGALSVDKGEIYLDWAVENRNGTPVLKFVWEEQGGPQPKKSDVSGFGTKLITGGLPGSQVHHEFLRGGAKCTIEVPITGAIINEPKTW